jgi:hypothetical protein
MDLYAVVKHLAWVLCLMVVLQAIFHFVFQIIDYNSFLLSVVLTATVLVVLVVLFVWRLLKNAVRNSN